MKKITVVANCQGEAISKFLRQGLLGNKWEIEYFSNNPRLGNMKSVREIINGIKQSDILIYQPLGEAHGELSETNIRQIVGDKRIAVSFPYIFNSGTYSLDINPHHPRSSYGLVYGEEIIIDLLGQYDFSHIIELYSNGLIDFDLRNRFQICMKEMEKREAQTDVKLVQFILENYQEKKLFLMHVHPTTRVFVEICSQIRALTDIPFSFDAIDSGNENVSGLPGHAPISPYDIRTHGYAFDYHPNWLNHGVKLIKLIADNNMSEKERNPIHKAAYGHTMEWFVKAIARDPLNANLHLNYANMVFKQGNAYLAFAELRTAQYFGAESEEIEEREKLFRASIPKQEYMNHNQYFRFFSLASAIMSKAKKLQKRVSVLDVGGGQGELASFISECSYCLVEPTVNGISGTELPFLDRSFDYVVSCHVLEHIPLDKRRSFLDQLLSKSVHGIILLNPFHIEGTHVEDRLKLFIEITGAQWAREHLACTLPKLQDIIDYATEKGLDISVQPSGTLTTGIALAFMDYFASRTGLQQQWQSINYFFNTKYMNILDSKDYPVAYLVYIGWREAVAHATVAGM